MAEYLSPGVYVEEIPSAVQAIAGVSTSTAAFVGIVPDRVQIPIPNPDYDPTLPPPAPATVARSTPDDQKKEDGGKTTPRSSPDINENARKPFLLQTFQLPTASGEVRLCTSFAEFRRYFGDFSTDRSHNILVHAAYGFFNNGGSRLYVARMKAITELDGILRAFEAIDEIAILAAPGMTDSTVWSAITAHCENVKTRFAILDLPESTDIDNPASVPDDSPDAAMYVPWVEVLDPAAKLQAPKEKGTAFYPPSGYMAGIYAHTDNERGVHKAPANEVLRGVIGLKTAISKAQQDGLNPKGVNCIRRLNGNIRVWGARTAGGDRNGEWRYINVRRLFLFLRKSIDLGTQWVVFEPNDLGLWAKITRNVTSFLRPVWWNGALFGATEAEAFFVKCDRDTNPPELRELGQVVTEIGVAIVRPAEFVIFRIMQWSAPEK